MRPAVDWAVFPFDVCEFILQTKRVQQRLLDNNYIEYVDRVSLFLIICAPKLSLQMLTPTAIIALLTSITLILVTDKFGRRLVVFVSGIACSITMLIVGILGFVDKTPPLQNFLIFVACVWSFFSNARK